MSFFYYDVRGKYQQSMSLFTSPIRLAVSITSAKNYLLLTFLLFILAPSDKFAPKEHCAEELDALKIP